MKLFRKKEPKSCCCDENNSIETTPYPTSKKQDYGIKILGSGCPKCLELEKATRIALSELQLDLQIEHITDFAEIASYGVISTPALVLMGKVISYGKVLSVTEIKALLSQ